LGAFVVWLPVVGYFYFNNALGDLWRDVVVFNLANYKPWPWWETAREMWRILGPGVVVWGGAIYLILKFKVQILKLKFEAKSLGFLIWLMALAPMPFILTRPYRHYWLQVLPFGILMVWASLGKNKWWKGLLIFNGLVAGIVMLVYGVGWGYPQQRLQIGKALEIEACGDFKEEPWLYYLSECLPRNKIFFEVR